MCMRWAMVLLLFSGQVRAEVAPFYFHLTTPARTLGKWDLAFENFPGATSNTSVLINSLSLGVSDWLQVGFVPLFLLFRDHRHNFNLKVNVVKEKYFQVGFGYALFSLRLQDEYIQEESGARTYSPFVDLSYFFTALNYRQPSSKYSFGVNYSIPQVESNSSGITKVLRRQIHGKHDWAMDVSYQLQREWAVAFGLGEARLETFELSSPFAFGYGFSGTHIRDAKRFSRITAGINYVPSEHGFKVLFSFDI